MARSEPHRAERDELARIDYFLDQLARAVERGEVPLASYEALAPRYLDRRGYLVEVLTAGAARRPAGVSAGVPVGVSAAAAASAKPVRPKREPVRWTTVLVFLGAFLVIVASAIFAVAVWDIASALTKLVFLGALTVAFYVTGHYARTKLQLKTGGSALTVVGSAMLLFDCWIAIDGFHLAGPFPWAVALLGCGAVYWLSEVMLGDRFYGVVGAAAQVGWWWLLGEGLGLQAPVRIAGIAAVALLWQLTAERVGAESAAGSLARMLQWMAPLVEALATAAIVIDLAAVGSPDLAAFASAAVVAAAGGIVVWRSSHVTRRAMLAAVLQVPFLVSAMLAPDVRWWLVAALALATASYVVVSLAGAGVCFAALALAAEFLMVGFAGTLLHASNSTGTAAYAALAVTWIAAARFSGQSATSGEREAFPGMDAFSATAWLGGFALLAWTSLLAVRGDALVLPKALTSTDVVVGALVLVAWAAASLVRRDRALAIGTAIWSYYALLSAVAWLAPRAAIAWRVLPLVALAGIWIAVSDSMERFYGVEPVSFAWLNRAIALVVVVVGLLAGALISGRVSAGSWATCAVASAGAVLFAWDAAVLEAVPSGAIAGILATVAAALGGGALGGGPVAGWTVADSTQHQTDLAFLVGSGGAVVFSAVAGAVRRVRRRQVNAFVVATAVAGTFGLITWGNVSAWRAACGLLLVAAAWCVGTAITEWYALAGVGTALALAAAGFVLSALHAQPWAGVGVFSLLAIGCSAASWVPALGPGGRLHAVGESTAVSSLASLPIVGFVSSGLVSWGPGADRWLQIDGHGRAVLLGVMGALVLVQAVHRRLEAGLYAGGAVLLFAASVELGAVHVTTAEFYSTLLALYIAAMGYVFAHEKPGRRIPLVLDIAAVGALLWTPVTSALSTAAGPDLFVHTAWALGLALVAIAAGIVLRVRSYLYGGSAALALVAVWRTMAYLAEFWWVLLGVIGIAMLVIALTWERQRLLLSETQRRLRDSFESWR